MKIRESGSNFRGDAAFTKPEIYEYLEEKGLLYAIRLPANDILFDEIKHLLTRPVCRPSRKPIIRFHDFVYQAASWQKKRRVVAKVAISKEIFTEILSRINQLRCYSSQ
jgi:hypothetical protein